MLDQGREGNDTLKLWASVIITIAGFIIQFVGLRIIHGAVLLAQLGAILLTTIVRAVLRHRRQPANLVPDMMHQRDDDSINSVQLNRHDELVDNMPAKVDADEEKGRADDHELSMAQKEIEGHELDALSIHFAGIKSFQMMSTECLYKPDKVSACDGPI